MSKLIILLSQLCESHGAKQLIRRGSQKLRKRFSLKKTPSLSKEPNLLRTRDPNRLLSDFELSLVRSSWASMGPDHSKFMDIVLAKVFEENANLQYLVLWDHVPIDVLMDQKPFKCISAHITHTVAACLLRDVGNDKNAQDQQGIGARHRRFKNFGFSENLFDQWADHFVRTIDKIFLDGPNKPALLAAWERVTCHIAGNVKSGFSHHRIASATSSNGICPYAAAIANANATPHSDHPSTMTTGQH